MTTYLHSVISGGFREVWDTLFAILSSFLVKFFSGSKLCQSQDRAEDFRLSDWPKFPRDSRVVAGMSVSFKTIKALQSLYSGSVLFRTRRVKTLWESSLLRVSSTPCLRWVHTMATWQAT